MNATTWSRFRFPVRRLLRPFAAVILFCCAYVLIRDALALFSMIQWRSAGNFDAAVDWKAAQLFWVGISPYSPEGLKFVNVRAFGHPPTTPFWFLPLHSLKHATFAEVIGISSMAMTAAIPAIIALTLRWPMPLLLAAVVFGIVQGTPTAIEHAKVIQISVWIALAYVLVWRWLRTHRDVEAGLALGFACTLKLFPGLMVVYLVLCRRWHAVAAACAAYAGVAAFMTARWGFSAWPLFFEQQKTISARWVTDVRNASLHGIVRRAFVGVCDKAPVDAPAATVTIVVSAIGLFGLGVWLWRRACDRQPELAVFDRSFGLFSLLSVFFNPWIWEHYFYLLILPAMLGWHAVTVETLAVYGRWRRGEVTGLRLMGTALVGLLTVAPAYVAYLAFSNPFQANVRTHRAACRAASDAALVADARYFEYMNWLPWVLFLLAAMALLAQRVPRMDDDTP